MTLVRLAEAPVTGVKWNVPPRAVPALSRPGVKKLPLVSRVTVHTVPAQTGRACEKVRVSSQ